MRPESRSGRSRNRWVLILLTLSALWGVGSAQAQDLFSWWSRDLLSIDLEAGTWVRFERLEEGEGARIHDIVRCEVLAAEEDGSRWIHLQVEGEDVSHVFLVQPALLGKSDSILDALLELHRLSPEGVEAKDVSQYREDRLVRRHFRDLFHEPTVTRSDLADTVLAGEAISRLRVVLEERDETSMPMGGRKLIHRTDIRSVAQLSPELPVFGVLASETVTTRTSHWEGDGPAPRRPPPPLISRVSIRLIEFGREARTTLPPVLERRIGGAR